MITSSGLEKIRDLQTSLVALMAEQFPEGTNYQESKTYQLYQKVSDLLKNWIERNPTQISKGGLSYYVNYVLPLCRIIPSLRKLTNEEYATFDVKQQKLFNLFNQHFSRINPVFDLAQNFSKKKSFARLVIEKDEGATLYYEFCKQLGAYTQWYIVDLFFDKIESVIAELIPNLGKDHQLIEQLRDLNISIELVSYLPTCFVDQTQMATLVTAMETCFNQLVKLKAYSEEKFSGLRKQLHDMSREFEVRETRRHERHEKQQLEKRNDTLQKTNRILADCLLSNNFSSVAVLEPNSRNRLLEIIAQTGNRDLLKKVLDNNPRLEIDYPNADDVCALEMTIFENHKEAAAYLKEKGALLERINSQRMTILQKAASEGNKAAVKLALQLKTPIDYLGGMRFSAFEVAVICHHFEAAAYLAEQGADINRIESGEPFLHWLVKEKNDSGIDFLLKLARDNNKKSQLLEATDNKGCTAWDKALQEPNYMILRAFKQYGVSIDALDNDGLPLLHRAAVEADLVLIEMLLALDCKVGMLDSEGGTALHTAFAVLTDAQLLIKVASVLLDAGLPGNKENTAGSTALDILKNRKLTFDSHPEVLSTIESYILRQEKQQSNEAYGKTLDAWVGWSPLLTHSYTATWSRKQFVTSKENFQQKASSEIVILTDGSVNSANAVSDSMSSTQPGSETNGRGHSSLQRNFR